MTINQQSEQMDSSNQSEFRTPAQKEKWNKLADIHKELSSMDIEITNSQIVSAMNNLKEMLKRLNYLVDSKQKYNVIFLGGSGEGKSTILNVLIGRDLLPSGKLKAITSTILNIQAKEDNEPEKVVINYNEPADLIKQINELISRVNKKQHENLGTCIEILNTGGDKRTKFENKSSFLKKIENGVHPDEKNYVTAIYNILDTYTLYCKDLENQNLPREYSISNELDKLHELIKNDKKSCLISNITFKINPSESLNEDMVQLLKENICLVDVPGFGSSNPIHEIVTKSYIEDKEPLFVFVIANDPRITNRTSLKALNWVYDNYIEKAKASGNEELLRIVSKCIFMVVNNKLNQINEKDIDDLDEEIRKLISNYTSQYYLHQFKCNGEDPKPYILVTPRPVAYLNKQYKEEDKSDLEFSYEKFAKSLGLSSDTDNIKDRQIIVDKSRIPFLVDQILSFLKDRRVNLQINRAYEYFNSWLEELENSLSSLLENYNYFSREDRAKRVLEGRKKDFQDQLEIIHNQFFVDVGNYNEPVTKFTAKFNSSLDDAKKDITEIGKDFKGKILYKIITEDVDGLQAIQTEMADLGKDINLAIRKNFSIYAEKCANELFVYFDSVLDDEGIKSKMTDITYENKYAHERIASRLANYKVNGTENIYEFYINSFKKDCTEAFRTLMISELLYENKYSAFPQLTMNTISSNNEKEVLTDINDQIDIVIKNVTQLLNDPSDSTLFKRLRKHFFYLYSSLKQNFELEYNMICDLHIIMLSNKPDLVNEILKTDNKHEKELDHLYTVLEEVRRLKEKLSTIKSTEK
jgi:GTP-binding protein EngB required for normal cell division